MSALDSIHVNYVGYVLNSCECIGCASVQLDPHVIGNNPTS